MTVDEAIQGLRGYCKPWDAGGAGGNDLASGIKVVLAEVERLRGLLLCASCDTDKPGGPNPAVICRECTVEAVAVAWTCISHRRGEREREDPFQVVARLQAEHVESKAQDWGVETERLICKAAKTTKGKQDEKRMG